MPRIPIFGPGLRAKSPFVTAKRMQNIYAEQRPQGEKASIVGYGTPGLTLFHDFGATPCRGGLEFAPNDVSYVVHRGVLWEVNNAGVATNVGMLLTATGRVSMAHNGVQVMIVDGTNGYIYNTATLAFTNIIFGFTIAPITVTYLSRRFIVNTGSAGVQGRFYTSAIDDGTTWSALDFATAEVDPDALVAVWSSNGQLILPGGQTMEFWGNSGALDFAFVALQGTATEWGLASRWSVAKYDNSIACLIKNRMGQVMVAKLNGYLPGKISTPDVDSIINGYANAADATAYSYMLGGHPMYVISFPSAGATWLYDGSTSMWTPLVSQGLTRHVGEFSFNLVGNPIIADYNVGRLYRLDPTALTDNGVSIERELVSENVAQEDLSYFEVDCVRLDMEVGMGLAVGQGSNPQISLSLSRDNGKTWGPDMWKTAGPVGQYRTRVEWRRLGTTREISCKFRLTDPVPLTIVSACLNPEN